MGAKSGFSRTKIWIKDKRALSGRGRWERDDEIKGVAERDIIWRPGKIQGGM
jgi:hypothetical protein